MDKVVARRLRPHEGRKLRRLERQHANAVNSRHARIILLARERLCNWEIAQRVGCTPAWVRRIIHRFNAGGIDGITWYPYYCHAPGSRKFLAEVTADRPDRPLAAAGAHRHERLVAAQAAGLPHRAGDPRLDLAGVAAADPPASEDPLASYQDLERVQRSGVLAQIPANPPPEGTRVCLSIR